MYLSTGILAFVATIVSADFTVGPLKTTSCPGSNTTVAFTFTDPNSKTGAQCNTSFAGKMYPTDYVSCDDGNLDDPVATAFKFPEGGFRDGGEFTLEVIHSYEDPSVGTPDIVTGYAHGNITQDADFSCTGPGADEVCSTAPGKTFPLVVYSSVA